MLQLKTFLESMDPKLWYLAASGIIFLLTWAWRRWFPNLWAAAVAKSPAIPQLWMTFLGAVISAAPAIGKPLGAFLEQFLVGAIFQAIGANGIHAFLRDMPVPYTGAAKQVQEAEARRTNPKGLPVVAGAEAVTPVDRPSPPKT